MQLDDIEASYRHDYGAPATPLGRLSHGRVDNEDHPLGCAGDTKLVETPTT